MQLTSDLFARINIAKMIFTLLLLLLLLISLRGRVCPRLQPPPTRSVDLGEGAFPFRVNHPLNEFPCPLRTVINKFEYERFVFAN